MDQFTDPSLFFKKQVQNLARANVFRLNQIFTCLGKEELHGEAFKEMEAAHKDLIIMRRMMLRLMNKGKTPPPAPLFPAFPFGGGEGDVS